MDDNEWMRTSSLRSLLRRDDGEYLFHGRACRLYASWIRGYSAEDLARLHKIGVEEVRADIQHVEASLPDKTVAAHRDGRNKILNAQADGEKRRQFLVQNLSKSAETLIQEGINPAEVLRAYREAVGMVKPRRRGRRRAIPPEPVQEAKDRSSEGGPSRICAAGADTESDRLPQGEKGPDPPTERGE